MEEASRALVECRYFDAERLCDSALQRAFAAHDYDRMARILLPLEEARRQKRDLAFDANKVVVVHNALPTGRALTAGCYLVCPPRVGADGRALREAADRKKVPTIIVVREPTTRDGMWPIVALGPVTVRIRVKPPAAPARRRKRKAGRRTAPGGNGALEPTEAVPGREWFLRANEQLGDAAIASVPAELEPAARVEELMMRLAAQPDHEKLHQALGEACRAAAKSGSTV